MLHPDFCRDANLFRAGAKKFGKTGRRHGTGHANLTLTADFRARNGGVHLVQGTHGAGRHKVANINIRADRFDKVIVVGKYRRYDSAGAVCRGRHHASAGCVLFVHGQGEHIHPVNDVHRVV